MRISELFKVPEGKKITEKVMTRVLISSVCSMLLCMACLAGTTWAWFTVSIENQGNVIQIAEAKANVTVQDSNNNLVSPEASGKYVLNKNQAPYQVSVSIENDANKLRNPVYVHMTVRYNDNGNEKTDVYCIPFQFDGTKNQWEGPKTINLNVTAESATVHFWVSWAVEKSVNTLSDPILIGTPEENPAGEGTTEKEQAQSDDETQTSPDDGSEQEEGEVSQQNPEGAGTGADSENPATEPATDPTVETTTDPTEATTTEPTVEETTVPTTEAEAETQDPETTP